VGLRKGRHRLVPALRVFAILGTRLIFVLQHLLLLHVHMPDIHGSKFRREMIILLESDSLPHAIEGNAHVSTFNRGRFGLSCSLIIIVRLKIYDNVQFIIAIHIILDISTVRDSVMKS
jgi:hypothetical protein